MTMLYFHHKELSPFENLAWDEALLEWAENGQGGESLRIWQSSQLFVVLGYSNKKDAEVFLPFCQESNIPVLRRISGGGTVLQGPGCLNFSVVLDYGHSPALSSITNSHQYILEKIQKALRSLNIQNTAFQGQSDLTWKGKKFSGNAQRRKKQFFLHHGSVLLNMDIALIEKTLRMPSKQPDYRQKKNHTDFLINLKLDPDQFSEAIRKEWSALPHSTPDLHSEISKLIEEKYSQKSWNEMF